MMWLCVSVTLVAYAFIVWDRFDRGIAALLGAFALLVLGLIPYEAALEYIELDVLLLLIGMMVVVHILSETGVFEWVAISIAQKAGGVGWKIMLGLLSATAFLSAFLDNVTTIILIAPITLLICEILSFRAAPFLLLEVMFANIGGAATLIGDPPNILIAHAGDLSFMDFIWHVAPGVTLVWWSAIILTYLSFSRSFIASDAARAQIQDAEPARAIVDHATLYRALPIFGLILLGFVLCHSIGLGPGSVAIVGAAVMTLVTRKNFEQVLRAVEWNTVIFLASLFILVGALNHFDLFTQLGKLLFGSGEMEFWKAILLLLWLSGIASAFLGSVPITMALIPLVQSLVPTLALAHGMEERAVAEPLWWALALGACLGGNGTMLGAPVNIVAIQIARQNRVPIGFMQFCAFGIPYALLGLLLSSAYLYLRYQ